MTTTKTLAETLADVLAAATMNLNEATARLAEAEAGSLSSRYFVAQWDTFRAVALTPDRKGVVMVPVWEAELWRASDAAKIAKAQIRDGTGAAPKFVPLLDALRAAVEDCKRSLALAEDLVAKTPADA